MKTRVCTKTVRDGRLRKARQFLDSALAVNDLSDGQSEISDAYVTLCVHAGIAASDVICCALLGEHATGENHNEAVDLLRLADRDAAKHLSALLQLKTKAGYGHASPTVDEFKRAGRAADALLEAARRANGSA